METKKLFKLIVVNGVPEITPDEFKPYVGKVTLIDVRQSDEFNGDLAHIPSAKLVTLGPDLDAFLQSHNKEDNLVFVCRSGVRSGQATLQSRTLGFSNSVNLQGGMLLWNKMKFPIKGGQ